MKKDTLKQQAKLSEKIILEENKDFYNNFIEENYPAKSRKLKLLFISAGSSLAVMLTIVLCFVFLWPSVTPTNVKNYLTENEQTVVSTLNELNLDLHEIKFEISESYSNKILRVNDSESNDTLFYIIRLVSDVEIISMNIYVNKDYKHKQEVADASNTAVVSEFTITFEEKIKQDDILYTFNYIALAKFKDLEIFLQYEELSLEENSNFLKFFEKTVKKI